MGEKGDRNMSPCHFRWLFHHWLISQGQQLFSIISVSPELSRVNGTGWESTKYPVNGMEPTGLSESFMLHTAPDWAGKQRGTKIMPHTEWWGVCRHCVWLREDSVFGGGRGGDEGYAWGFWSPADIRELSGRTTHTFDVASEGRNRTKSGWQILTVQPLACNHFSPLSSASSQMIKRTTWRGSECPAPETFTRSWTPAVGVTVERIQLTGWEIAADSFLTWLELKHPIL